jgi:hypothetical protein
MPATPAETNCPVLLEQARRYVDAEGDLVGSLQTRAASLLAAVLVLVGLAFTVESQLSNRSAPRWISLTIAGISTLSLLIGASGFVRALVPLRTLPNAPQTIRVMLAPWVADTDPVLLTRQLIETLADELDQARSEGWRIQGAMRFGRRWLVLGVLGIFALAALFGATHDLSVVQRVRIVNPVVARVLTPVSAKIIAPVETRIVAPVHVKVVGQVRARLAAAITVVNPPEDPSRR